jgi:hypothetical protein
MAASIYLLGETYTWRFSYGKFVNAHNFMKNKGYYRQCGIRMKMGGIFPQTYPQA